MPFILESPLAMWGLLTLLIPLGIHLLSKARPRVIAFAHIAFIKVSTSPVLRQLRLTQLILLGLRMAMLMLATLILTQLYWQNVNLQVNSHILLTEDWLNHATDIEKQTLIDQVKGSDLVLISSNNRNINTAELAQWSTNSQQTPVLNLWSKVADYTAQLAADSSITVYTTNRLKHFIGSKVPLPRRVQWQVKTIPVETVVQENLVNIKVIYDNSSEPLLVYLRAAFEVINTQDKLSAKVDYDTNNISSENSGHLLIYDKIIDLREQRLTQQGRPFELPWQHTYITQAALNNVKQADFALTLTRLLYSSQSQSWWLENARLSTGQIIQNLATGGNQLVPLPFKKQTIKASPSKNTHGSSLHIWLVLMLIGIFILERILSEWPNCQLKAGVDE
ncbi:BatA domain-containing protein [Paraglaciecola sp. MB-3u-78]|uniref:BatA domain-containing protein n=1 Tax=Paraglaciecola sp. MB-3u-78 TaxID=2058332 RepID=UPI001E3B9DE5|nr:BatA domain-containing protein [Paraglaciecola sp. MB-3u-78]